MKKETKKSIKEILFTYLAISKLLYWINIATAADSFESVGRAVSQRLINRDIVLILVIVFIFLFEKKVVMKQKNREGILAQIILAVGGYIMFGVILVGYLWILSLVFSVPFSAIDFLRAEMISWTVIFFIIMGALIAKEHFKKKEAYEYALDVQSKNIKLEMLETLRDEKVLSQKQFDKQKEKLFEA